MFSDFSAIARRIALFSLLTLGGIFCFTGNTKAEIIPTAQIAPLGQDLSAQYTSAQTCQYFQTFTANVSGVPYAVIYQVKTNFYEGDEVSGSDNSHRFWTGATIRPTTSTGSNNNIAVATSASTSASLILNYDDYSYLVYHELSAGTLGGNLTAGNVYNVQMCGGGIMGGSDRMQFYGSSTTAYTGGSFQNVTSGVAVAPQDITVTVLVNSTSTEDGITEIYFDPNFNASASTTCDFGNWAVRSTLSETFRDTYPNGAITSINWGFAPEALTFYDYAPDVAPSLYGNPLTYFIEKGSPITGESVIYAQAYICNSVDPDNCDFQYSSNAQYKSAESEVQSFLISSCEGPVWSPGDDQPVPIENIDTNLCENVEGALTAGLCKVFTFLFAPGQDTIDKFSALQDMIASKPPFGYVSVFSDAINTLSTASSTTSTAFSTVTSSNYLELDEWTDLEFFGTVRTYLGYIIWGLFIFYIFLRFRHFSLHG